MPLCSDPSLWFNLPGVVAAYQPVRAPDSLLARYNQAHGGDNRYRAQPVGAATWNGAGGWTVQPGEAYNSGLIYNRAGAVIVVAYKHTAWSDWFSIFGVFGDSYNRVSLFPNYNSLHMGFISGTDSLLTVPKLTTKKVVMGMSGNRCFANGNYVGNLTILYGGISLWPAYFCGSNDNSGGALSQTCSVSAAAIYAKALPDAAMIDAMRQMSYCDVNPDWSVWARKRRWFYGSQVAAAYARRIADVGRIGSRGIVE